MRCIGRDSRCKIARGSPTWFKRNCKKERSRTWNMSSGYMCSSRRIFIIHSSIAAAECTKSGVLVETVAKQQYAIVLTRSSLIIGFRSAIVFNRIRIICLQCTE